ncbi:MAG: hypothetical protein AAFW66_16440, partial [Pseudomonadota bacterium]
IARNNIVPDFAEHVQIPVSGKTPNRENREDGNRYVNCRIQVLLDKDFVGYVFDNVGNEGGAARNSGKQ